ncbi:plectin-like isoform X2 [Panicum virgatum]|uniref:Uncharacterized protein n=1 Tax=Panicum virgatum TaxID=38727 RepID=A0A8T0X826_PANVG|nr:plectin-like isoform X2 [Panicum virgatum]KAG2655585.1 hypothetical protein PVAP13_1KG013500 [Panicum virgatum]
MAAATEEEFTDAELEVATILCGLKKTLRARDRRRAQRLLAAPELPSWGRRRPRSMPEEKPAAPAPVLLPASGVAERDGAASPDTPLAYPESGGDDAPMEEEEDAKKPTSHDQWVQEQHGVVASLSQENAHLLTIEEYRARLQSSRSTNESLKQLHKVKREEEEQEQARKRPRVAAQAPGAADPRAAAALGLDLNEPARAAEEDEQARAQAQAQAAAAAAFEYYRFVQRRAAMEKAAVSAGARRRRLEILRAKVACPLVSSRPRRAG